MPVVSKLGDVIGSTQRELVQNESLDLALEYEAGTPNARNIDSHQEIDSADPLQDAYPKRSSPFSVKIPCPPTELCPAPENEVWVTDRPSIQHPCSSLHLEANDNHSPKVFGPETFLDKDRSALELNDVAWDHPPPAKEHLGLEETKNEIGGFASEFGFGSDNHDGGLVPGMETKHLHQKHGHSTKSRSNESISKDDVDSWQEASERVAQATIQSLTKEKDTELSYVHILSSTAVLNSKHGLQGGEGILDSAMKVYSKLLRIMTRHSTAERLANEAHRQGIITPSALYFQFYNAIQCAGYQLEDDLHLLVSRFLLDHNDAENALSCLGRIDPKGWIGVTYRTAISCHLFSKPRHLHEAQVLLDKYLLHSRALHLRQHNGILRPNSRDHQELERASKVMIQKWFKLQLEASKWVEIKTQYERRRARLLKAPGNIERFSSFSLFNLDVQTERSGEAVGGVEHPHDMERAPTASSSSSSSTASLSASDTGHQSDLSAVAETTQQPSEPQAAKTDLPTKRRFSFLSAFRSTSSSVSPVLAKANAPSSIDTAPPNINIKHQKSAKKPPPKLTPLQTTTPIVNRHLTVLDNSMLEECINHRQFEYGWKQVYERMGPARLEDKDTAKIALRLCKRAFLGHGGLCPNVTAGSTSPNLLAKDMCFEDEPLAHDGENSDDNNSSSSSGGVGDTDDKREGFNEADQRLASQQPLSRWKTDIEEDPEVWEARAWAIYNKAMRSPFFFHTSGGSPISGSPTRTQHSATAGSSASTGNNGSFSGPGGGSGSALSLTSPIAIMAGTTSVAVFLHNILTVAINSPEPSSRYMKAFKVYGAMRSDPLNQYQAQLRDPFVMTCMVKAIYDTVLTIVRDYSYEHGQQQDLKRKHSSQMSIGPLIDLAFEIYADMRNVGPIRHLPRLSALEPSTPLSKTPKTPGLHNPSLSNTGGDAESMGPSMSMFFHLSGRPTASSSSLTRNGDLSACGIVTAGSGNSTSISNVIMTRTASDTTVHLQDLNPTLQPSQQARRLPSELYLALLHLCIQVPLSGLTITSRVVKTIVADTMSTKGGQQPANLDTHLAAALQFYHDRWMCRPQELKERTPTCTRASVNNCERELVSVEDQNSPSEGCIFHGWMYQPDDYILKHTTPSNATSANSSTNELCIVIPSTDPSISEGTVVVAGPLSTASNEPANADNRSNILDDETSHYGISKHDADLDELDQYLNAKMQHSDQDNDSRTGAATIKTRHASWMDGLEHGTCNDRFYWDLWDRQNPVLQTIRFSRRRARMLWRHIGSMEM
ncbi:hypothetical protein BGX28_003394 [Mortierella sp. GBA30]|nr:hypothetical protein BGX28_003394 [Mortierella sp. GBA30]